LPKEQHLGKTDPLVMELKTWVDEQYEEGRQTVMSYGEMIEKIQELAPGRFHI
jgi:hypothetical protein